MSVIKRNFKVFNEITFKLKIKPHDYLDMKHLILSIKFLRRFDRWRVLLVIKNSLGEMKNDFLEEPIT